MAARWQQNYQLYRRYLRNLSLMYQRREDVQTYVELLLTMSVIIIFALFAIRPTFVTVTELAVQIDSKKDTIKQLDQKIDSLSEAQDLFNQNRVAIALVDSTIPNEPLPDIFTRQFEGLTQKNETTVLNISAGEVKVFGSTVSDKPQVETKTKKKEEVDLFPVDASSWEYSGDVGGSYDKLFLLLKEIEKMRRPLFIDQISLYLSKNEFNLDLTMSVSARVPYLTVE